MIVLTGLVNTVLLVAGVLAFPGVVSEFAPTDPVAHISLPLSGGSTPWGEYQTWSEELAKVLWSALAVASLATLIWLVTGQHEQALMQ